MNSDDLDALVERIKQDAVIIERAASNASMAITFGELSPEEHTQHIRGALDPHIARRVVSLTEAFAELQKALVEPEPKARPTASKVITLKGRV